MPCTFLATLLLILCLMCFSNSNLLAIHTSLYAFHYERSRWGNFYPSEREYFYWGHTCFSCCRLLRFMVCNIQNLCFDRVKLTSQQDDENASLFDTKVNHCILNKLREKSLSDNKLDHRNTWGYWRCHVFAVLCLKQRSTQYLVSAYLRFSAWLQTMIKNRSLNVLSGSPSTLLRSFWKLKQFILGAATTASKVGDMGNKSRPVRLSPGKTSVQVYFPRKYYINYLPGKMSEILILFALTNTSPTQDWAYAIHSILLKSIPDLFTFGWLNTLYASFVTSLKIRLNINSSLTII